MTEEKKPILDQYGTNLETTVRKCNRCGITKARINFVKDFDDPHTTSNMCRPCLESLISLPKYKERAITNLLKHALEKNDYQYAMDVALTLIKKATDSSDMGAINTILDRVDGPIKQQMQVDVTTTEKLVAAAEEMKAKIRIPDEDQPPTVH